MVQVPTPPRPPIAQRCLIPKNHTFLPKRFDTRRRPSKHTAPARRNLCRIRSPSAIASLHFIPDGHASHRPVHTSGSTGCNAVIPPQRRSHSSAAPSTSVGCPSIPSAVSTLARRPHPCPATIGTNIPGRNDSAGTEIPAQPSTQPQGRYTMQRTTGTADSVEDTLARSLRSQ